jgi:poly-beta-hydroxyalkanoate depolymerase
MHGFGRGVRCGFGNSLRYRSSRSALRHSSRSACFYDQYLAVNDLAMGRRVYRGRTVDCGAIRRTALMTVEGERDDICSMGRTMSAQDLRSNVRPARRVRHTQTGVGDYGVFSGSKWNQQICCPRVRETIYLNAA